MRAKIVRSNGRSYLLTPRANPLFYSRPVKSKLPGWGLAAVGGVAVAAGVGTLLYVSQNAGGQQPPSSGGGGPPPSSGGCPTGTVAAGSSGCPAGYVPDPLQSGCCIPQCPGGSSPCTEDSGCPGCEECVGGCCGNRIPMGVVDLSNPIETQKEVIYNYSGMYCMGLSFQSASPPYLSGGSAIVATYDGKLVDSGGSGVPCQTVILQFEHGVFQFSNGSSKITMETASTKNPIIGKFTENGEFFAEYQLPSPYGTVCPAPAQTQTVTALDTLNIYLGNGTIVGKTDIQMDVTILGVPV